MAPGINAGEAKDGASHRRGRGPPGPPNAGPRCRGAKWGLSGPWPERAPIEAPAGARSGTRRWPADALRLELPGVQVNGCAP